MTPEELVKLAEAMNWVIPSDSSPGAGSEQGVKRMVDFIESLPPLIVKQYSENLANLQKSDLDDPNHNFAHLLIEHVKDVYYSHLDTGAWADIGFRVKEP